LSTIFRGNGQESSQSRHKYLLAIIHHSTTQHSLRRSQRASNPPLCRKAHERETAAPHGRSSYHLSSVFAFLSPPLVAPVLSPVWSLSSSFVHFLLTHTPARLHATSPRQRALAYLSRLACDLLPSLHHSRHLKLHLQQHTMDWTTIVLILLIVGALLFWRSHQSAKAAEAKRVAEDERKRRARAAEGQRLAQASPSTNSPKVD